MKKQLPIFIILILLAGVGGFFIGQNFPTHTNQVASNFGPGQMPGFNLDSNQPIGQGRINRSNTNIINGEILNKDENSLTLKLPDGGSKIILYSQATSFTQLAESSVDGFNIGEQITVIGTNNDDGSVTAQSVQKRPEMFFENNNQP